MKNMAMENPAGHVLCAAQKHHQEAHATRRCRPNEQTGPGGNQEVPQGK